MPRVPETETQGFLTAGDGTRLFTRNWDSFQPKAHAIVVHGIGEHSGRYEWLAQSLAQRHWVVWALDHRGHGRSGGGRGDCAGLESLIGDLDRLVDLQAETAGHLPCLMVGHSLGGLIALTYAARYPEKIKAVAVSSPALKLTHPPSPLKTAVVTAVSKILPGWPFPNGVNPKNLCHDPAVVDAYERDPLVHRVIRARCAVSLNRAMKESLSLADRLKIPCLILQAGADEVCDPLAVEAFAQRARKSPTTFRSYPDLYHELFNEPQKEQVLADLLAWAEEALRS